METLTHFISTLKSRQRGVEVVEAIRAVLGLGDEAAPEGECESCKSEAGGMSAGI